MNTEIVDKVINIQTGEELDLGKVEGLRDNTMLKVKPEIWIEWDFKRNDELGLDIWKITHGSKKRVWLVCPKCRSGYDTIPQNKVRNQNCPYCAGVRVNHTNSLASLNPQLASQWHPTKNGDLTPHDVTCNSHIVVWWVCDKGHETERVISARNSGQKCGICTGKIILKGFNDLWSTNRPLANILLNPEDGYKYSYGSQVKVSLKCPRCGNILKNKKISEYIHRLPNCPKCGDKRSMGEKIVYYVLDKLNIEFSNEKGFIWSNTRRYDFFLHEYNLIIETHGLQHYKNIKRRNSRTLEEEQVNDKYKYEMAVENGIENYIVIDCRYSELEWVKHNILNSKLAILFDLSEIDWEEVLVQTSNSLLIKSKDLFNSGMNVREISEELRLAKSTVTYYLNKATKYEWCNYNGKEERRKSDLALSKSIVQMTLSGEHIKTWDSVSTAVLGLGKKSTSSIYRCINGQTEKVYGFKWMLLSEYENSILIKGDI